MIDSVREEDEEQEEAATPAASLRCYPEMKAALV